MDPLMMYALRVHCEWVTSYAMFIIYYVQIENKGHVYPILLYPMESLDLRSWDLTLKTGPSLGAGLPQA